MQRLADRITQHGPMSIMKKSNTIREQPHICKKNSSKIKCESAIGQHLTAIPCTKTYTDDNF